MPVPLEQFVKHLEESGIIAGDMLQDFIPPKSSPKDAEELARELVRKKRLTKFPAEEVWQGFFASAGPVSRLDALLTQKRPRGYHFS